MRWPVAKATECRRVFSTTEPITNLALWRLIPQRIMHISHPRGFQVCLPDGSRNLGWYCVHASTWQRVGTYVYIHGEMERYSVDMFQVITWESWMVFPKTCHGADHPFSCLARTHTNSHQPFTYRAATHSKPHQCSTYMANTSHPSLIW